MIKRLSLPVAVAVIVIGVGAYLQGLVTDRWGMNRSEVLAEFEKSLKGVPKTIGEWESEDFDVDPDQIAASNCTGYVSRVYRNEVGEEVNVFLVCGTARNVTLHTPDWCYRAAGFKQERDHIAYAIDCGSAFESAPEFRTAKFRKDDSTGSKYLRIFWSFAESEGKWEGVQWPRSHYTNHPALYKVYLIAPVDVDQPTPEHSPCTKFARVFLPELNKVLFPEKPDPASTSSEQEES